VKQTVVHDEPIRSSKAFAAVDSQADLGHSAYAEKPIALSQRKSIMLSPRLSDAGATCKVAVALGTYEDEKWKPLAWHESATLTASATFKLSDGKYATPSVEFATANYTHAKVHLTAISAGTAEIGYSAY
jgi:hypothetical protein